MVKKVDGDSPGPAEVRFELLLHGRMPEVEFAEQQLALQRKLGKLSIKDSIETTVLHAWVNRRTFMDFLVQEGRASSFAGRAYNRLAERYLIRTYGARTGLSDSTVREASNGYFPVNFHGIEAYDLKHYDDSEIELGSLKTYVEYLEERVAVRGTDDIVTSLTQGFGGPELLKAWRQVVDHWVPGSLATPLN